MAYSLTAAVTSWYAGYYDAWLGGQYFKKVDEMHAKYGTSGSTMSLECHSLNVLGPIVRINPDELHVSDLAFVDEIFPGPGSKKRDKHTLLARASLRKSVTVPCLRQEILTSMISVPQATGATVAHDLHRTRRGALNPFFSKGSVRRLDPVIQHTTENLLRRFDGCAKTGEIMPLNIVYKAATSDVVSGYTFGISVDYLKKDDYNAPFFEALSSSFEMAWWFMHMPSLASFMNSMPKPVLSYLMPGMESLFEMQAVCSLIPATKISSLTRSAMGPSDQGNSRVEGPSK